MRKSEIISRMLAERYLYIYIYIWIQIIVSLIIIYKTIGILLFAATNSQLMRILYNFWISSKDRERLLSSQLSNKYTK
jgi:hypothetical protein